MTYETCGQSRGNSLTNSKPVIIRVDIRVRDVMWISKSRRELVVHDLALAQCNMIQFGWMPRGARRIMQRYHRNDQSVLRSAFQTSCKVPVGFFVVL